MLTDALLNDRAFMEGLIQRLAAIPEWRAVAAAQFAPKPAGVSPESARPETPSAAVALYVCPMHPDVTASKPGECPKCGMTLVRSALDHK
jgi:hypothetical protein